MSRAWVGDRRGAEQNVHGARPSFVQIILPQERQLGAAERRGCWRPMQRQRLRDGSGAGMVGLVDSSRARMAESRSVRVVEAPCMAVPPEMETFVDFGLLWEAGAGEVPRDWEGVELRDLAGVMEVRTLGRTGSRRVGTCFAAGMVERENWVEMLFLRDDDVEGM